MVARQGDRDGITGRKSPTCAQHQWTSRIEILPTRPSSHPAIRPSSHPHSCPGITGIPILAARPYCGRCAVSASGLAAAIPVDVLGPRMLQFSKHIWCRRIVSNVHRCSQPALPQAAKCVFFFFILRVQLLAALHKSCSAPSSHPLRNPLKLVVVSHRCLKRQKIARSCQRRWAPRDQHRRAPQHLTSLSGIKRPLCRR